MVDNLDPRARHVLGAARHPQRAPTYYAETVTANTGAVVAGTIFSTYADDGTRLQLSETTGPPGSDYDFTFYDLPANSVELVFNGYYEGNPAHNFKVQQYNFSTLAWTNLTAATNDIPSGVADVTYEWPIFTSASYIQAGEARFKFVHTSAGNITHYLWVDSLKVGITPVVSQTETITVTDSPAVTVSAPQIAESEAVGVAATSVTVAIQEATALTIAESDAVGVTDTPTVALASSAPLEVNVSDAVGVYDIPC